MTKKYLFKLYLSGRTSINEQGIANLKKILENIKAEKEDRLSTSLIYQK